MTIVQFRYATDNFSYLVHGSADALVIDGGAVDAITTYCAQAGLAIRFVTNTHSHPDHTFGNPALIDRTGASFLVYDTLIREKAIDLESETLRVLNTPGHTMDSVTFYIHDAIITGDTLFNGTVGNCFSGNLKAFYESIVMLMALPDDTVVYAGHDYVAPSMAFAKQVEPDNRAVDDFLTQYRYDNVQSTLKMEKQVNPYLRFNEKSIIHVLKKKRLSVDSAYQRWESIMSIE
ncbi:MAG: MBL fold metallo-hydrolase [Deltaproteobacteria bacterium]|nr:MBL fold metallo-hydrolase [Deltaproteobacteria bacterium]